MTLPIAEGAEEIDERLLQEAETHDIPGRHGVEPVHGAGRRR